MTTGIGAHNNMRRVNNDFLINQCTTGYYVDMPAADQTQGTVFDGSAQQAQASSNCEDGQDDGHISLWSKFKNAVKGVGNFFKGMVCDENGNFSLGQTLKTVAIGVGVGALCVLTAGTAVPAIVATAGIAMSGYGLAKAGIAAANAKTDAEAEAAWQSIGSNSTALGLSLLGAKSLAKANAAAGVEGYSGNYSGVSGTMRAAWHVGKHAFSPVKSAFVAAKAGAVGGGGLTGAMKGLRTDVSAQWGEFATTVKGNYNRIVFGTQNNIAEDAKSLAEREQKLSDKLAKSKEGTHEHELLQRQYNEVHTKRLATEKMNGVSSTNEGQTIIDKNVEALDAQKAQLAKTTDVTERAQIQGEITRLEQTIKTQKDVLTRRVHEINGINDRIKTLNDKVKNLTAEDPNYASKITKYADEIKALEIQKANGIEISGAPATKVDMTQYAETMKQYNSLRTEVAKGELTPPTTPEGIAKLNQAQIDLQQVTAKFNSMRSNLAREQLANSKGGYYEHGASEVGRQVWNQFTTHRKADPTAFRLTLATAGRNDEFDYKLAQMLPEEARGQFLSLTTEQRAQVKRQWGIAA